MISSGVFKNVAIGGARNEENKEEDVPNALNTSPNILWKSITDIFDKDLNRVEVWSVAFLCLAVVRISTIFIIIPLWIVLGLFTAGCAWPDQWRKRLLEQKITTHSNSSQIPGLKTIMDDLDDLQREVATKLASNQEVVIRLKADVVSIQTTVNEDLKEIRKAMSTFLETQKVLYS